MLKRWVKIDNFVSNKEITDYLTSLGISFSVYGKLPLRIDGFSSIPEFRNNTICLVTNDVQLDAHYPELQNKNLLIFTERILSKYSDFPVLQTAYAEFAYYKVLENFFLAEKTEKDGPENEKIVYGANIVIGDNVTINGPAVIGDNVVIQAGAIIGTNGFGYYQNNNGKYEQIPDIGRTVIGNNVEIGANTCIDRGMTGTTYIGNGVKIANLCHIAHDVKVCDHTIIAAKASISSNAEIGENCFIGAGATIKDKLYIGNNNFIGLGSVVKDNIHYNKVIFGNPATNYVRKKKLLQVSNINKTYDLNESRTQHTLKDISFEILDNEFLTIIGPSGCGKTTLLRIMAGLLKAENGDVSFTGAEDSEKNIHMVFQDDALFPWMKVDKNVALGLKLKKQNEMEYRDKVQWAIDLVGLTGYEKYFPYQLSGGMKKRVAIARCLVLNSNLLLMDEPFGALDIVTRKELQQDILTLKEKEGFSICMVTHDIEEAILLSDRIVIVKGKPASIKEVVSIDIPLPRRVDSEEFQKVKSMISNIMNDEQVL